VLAVLLLLLQAPEVVAEIRVHGNAVIAQSEVAAIAGLQPGDPFTADTIAAVEQRLDASGRFRSVEVLKRFASIADPTRIVVLIIVDEGPVKIEVDRASGAPRTVRRRAPPVMFLPILDAEDGYGFTYGVRFALPNVVGARSRVSFPLTWGGDKRAAVQLEKDIERGPVDRVSAGVSVSRREHPFYEQNDDRRRVWMRLERGITSQLRAGATVGSERVQFLKGDSRFVQTGVDLVLDTRVDPMLARNAVYVRTSWDRYLFQESNAYHMHELDVRGYAGLIGQGVLVGRVLHAGADRGLPLVLQPMLGGMRNLRGFKTGTAVADTLAAGSLELRLPITSPLNVGKIGLSAFVDAAAVYDHRARLRDQRFEKGFGGGVWVSAAFLRLNLVVAHGVGGSTRAHFGTSLSF
jgi:outer membrane protein assembly factor BamA